MKTKVWILALFIVGISVQTEATSFAMGRAQIVPGKYDCTETTSGNFRASITVSSDKIEFSGFVDVASAHQGDDAFWISEGSNSNGSETYVLKQPGLLGIGAVETDYQVDDAILSGLSSGSLTVNNSSAAVPGGQQAEQGSTAYNCTRVN